jgi:hypothetical protein
MFFRK